MLENSIGETEGNRDRMTAVICCESLSTSLRVERGDASVRAWYFGMHLQICKYANSDYVHEQRGRYESSVCVCTRTGQQTGTTTA